MQIVSLRTLRPQALDLLLEEQTRFWREHFLWDYRPAVEMIRRFIQSHSLEGFAATEDGLAHAYCFYFVEESKALIGDCFIAASYSDNGAGRQLLAQVIESLDGAPGLRRIETHILPPDAEIQELLAARNFRLHERQFMRLDLAKMPGDPGKIILPSSGLVLERFSGRNTEGGARLIQLAYASHVDGEINDQYRSEEGASRFLRNLMQTQANGEFIREGSFVLRPRMELQPAGMVLASRVADGVAHITQICVMPGYQHNGMGRAMMAASIEALRKKGFRDLTLTVTSANVPAVRLYESLGFHTMRRFFAGYWRA
jgi:ribosomal protein S18 acetylase RimI-like enzyme